MCYVQSGVHAVKSSGHAVMSGVHAVKRMQRSVVSTH